MKKRATNNFKGRFFINKGTANRLRYRRIGYKFKKRSNIYKFICILFKIVQPISLML